MLIYVYLHVARAVNMSMTLLTIVIPAPDQTAVPAVPRQAQDLLDTVLAQTCLCNREYMSILKHMFMICESSF